MKHTRHFLASVIPLSYTTAASHTRQHGFRSKAVHAHKAAKYTTAYKEYNMIQIKSVTFCRSDLSCCLSQKPLIQSEV